MTLPDIRQPRQENGLEKTPFPWAPLVHEKEPQWQRAAAFRLRHVSIMECVLATYWVLWNESSHSLLSRYEKGVF